jgi:hypothetical protein
VIAQQIRDLDAAAQRVASNVEAAAQKLRAEDSSTRGELTASVADALVDRTAEIRNDCERLASLVTRSAKLIAEREGRESTATAPSAPPPPPQIAPAPEPEAEAEAPAVETAQPERLTDDLSDTPVPVSASGGTSEGVRLIATQMAIAGSSRAEIEHRLRIQFGVVDASQALDDIFGNRRSGVQ